MSASPDRAAFKMTSRRPGAQQTADRCWAARCHAHAVHAVDDSRAGAQALLRDGESDYAVAASVGVDAAGTWRLARGREDVRDLGVEAGMGIPQ